MARIETDPVGAAATPPSISTDRQIERRRLVAKLVRHVAPIEAALAEAEWQLATTGEAEHVETLRASRALLDRTLADEEIWRSLHRWVQEGPTDDPALDRSIVLLERRFADRRIDADLLDEIGARESELQRAYSVFRGEIDGLETSQTEIERILVESDDSTLREKAWAASKQVARAVREPVIELIELRNRAALSLGYRDFYAMRLERQELSEDELLATLTKLEKATRTPFRTRKAVLDGELARRFKTSAEALCPWHYEDPYFQRVQPSGGLKLDESYRSLDIEDVATRFFDGIGMNVRDVVEHSDLSPRDGKSQHAFCTHIDRAGDIRVLANLLPSQRSMTILLHELGHAVYERYLEQPWELATPAHALMTEAVAMLMGRQSTDIEFLIEYAGIPAFDVTPLSGELRRYQCFRMQVFVRWALVMSHFERELYADPRREDLDALWWEYKRKYQLVEPPEGRDEPDWAAKPHLALFPVYYQNYLLGELVASQLKAAICVRSRSASIIDSQCAGEFLIEKVFRPGASRRWDALLAEATDEELNPQHFIREFTG